MLFEPRDYQHSTIEDAVMSLSAGLSGLYVLPTAAGKSLIWAGILDRVPDIYVSAPQLEICAGIYRMWTGIDLRDESEAKQRAAYEEVRIFTDKRLYTLIRDGKLPLPKYLGHDEAHHEDDTHDALHELVGHCPRIGLTATDYGGTPQRTEKIRKQYGGRVMRVLSERAAVERGVCHLPTFRTEPVLNDDQIDVTNGEFNIRSCEGAFRSKIEFLVDRMSKEWDGISYRLPSTLVAPSVATVDDMVARLNAAGLPATAVTAKTKHRNEIFKDTVNRKVLLVQNLVVGEGIDLPLGFMYDCNPTMSPMRWRQRVGRICRVTGLQHEYVSACHNLLRHGYLFEDLIPPTTYREAIKVWGDSFRVSRRTMARALGMTGLGKLEPAQVPLLSGDEAWLYVLKADSLTNYAAVLVPHDPKPRYYERIDRKTGEMKTFEPRPGVKIEYEEKARGKWTRIDAVPELKGASSYAKETITGPMLKWWGNAARSRGLDGSYTPNWKEWMLLPILSDTKEDLR